LEEGTGNNNGWRKEQGIIKLGESNTCLLTYLLHGAGNYLKS
jgi:hypothetical protein